MLTNLRNDDSENFLPTPSRLRWRYVYLVRIFRLSSSSLRRSVSYIPFVTRLPSHFTIAFLNSGIKTCFSSEGVNRVRKVAPRCSVVRIVENYFSTFVANYRLYGLNVLTVK